MISQTYELRRDPKERKREKVEDAAEKFLAKIGDVVDLDGRKFNIKTGTFLDDEISP